jgi:phosphoribosylformylglycinamidine synthase
MQLPPGTLPPRRILTDVVSGVRDYGNRMGIPTVNGAVHFNDRFVGNPLVFCGCIGLIPRTHVHGGAKAGDHIIALGGRTGRDGIHGATFSSAELESTHADEFSHAVQIGNAIEEKRTLDAILRARDAGLYSGMTDCGAGGFSSAVGEMGSSLGATVHLERAPLKYAGLSYTEIWISEAQERMVLAVPEKNLAALAKICAEECVEMADLGIFGTPNADLILNYQGTEVGRLSMHFMHEGIPQPTREARWSQPVRATSSPVKAPAIGDALTSLLSHPNIASKHWIIRQYDHEVQGNTLVKPLVGPGGRGPGDAAVIEPISGSNRGIALGCGLQIHGGVPSDEVLAKRTYEGDPYLTTLAGIDECIRNLVCVGANPNRIAILDNFCWPSCEKPENLGTLVRAAQACYDGAMAYRTPFVSGKDSLNNQLRYEDPATGEKRVIEIPPTLLITGMGIVNNVNRCVTMDAKAAGNTLLLIGATSGEIGGSHFAQLYGDGGAAFPVTDLKVGPGTARAVAQCIADGLVQSAHDCSDGGLLVAVAEMLIATTGRQASAQADLGSGSSALGALLTGQADLQPLGATLTIKDDLLEAWELAFAENPSRYVLEVKPENVQKIRNVLRDFDAGPCVVVGTLNTSGVLTWQTGDLHAKVVDLAQAWLSPLAW